MRIEYLSETVSTNDDVKKYLAGGEDVIVCARRQTGGRGTKGRSFLSEEGGVYLSALRFYRDLPARQAFSVMTHAAVSVVKTLARFGVEGQIKWPNDVLVGGKKICGILIENYCSGDAIGASVVGIGLNVRNPLFGLESIATSLSELLPAPPSVEEVRDALVEEYGRETTFSEYLSRVGFLGREVCVAEGKETYVARARRILPDGRLEIEREGAVRALSAAEISIGSIISGG